MSRMDRYHGDEEPMKRLDKNQELYQNYSNQIPYTNAVDISDTIAYEIPSGIEHKTYTTREDYQKYRNYQNGEDIPQTRKELLDFNHLYPSKENKIYDINSVLEEARKNRLEKDENEKNRRLKNNSYNILSGVNKKELEKYREEKKKRILTPEEEEIRELIDTIASKTLAGEIDKATSVDLLSDLMATSIMDKVESSEKLDSDLLNPPEIIVENIEEMQVVDEVKEEEKQEEVEKEEAVEEKEEFYTKSMDLSDKDFNLSDEFKESSLPWPVKVLIFLVILGIIGLAGFFIWQKYF